MVVGTLDDESEEDADDVSNGAAETLDDVGVEVVVWPGGRENQWPISSGSTAT